MCDYMYVRMLLNIIRTYVFIIIIVVNLVYTEYTVYVCILLTGKICTLGMKLSC